MSEAATGKGSTAEAPEIQGIYAPESGAEPEKEQETAEETETAVEETPATEGSPEQEATEAGSEAEGEEATGPPEQYEWNLPEGMELDQIGVEEFEPIAREWGLTQKQLDQAMGLFTNRMQQTVESVVDAMRTQAEAHSEALRKETEADKEIGKEGLRAAARAIERFGSDELKEVLDESGLGNHRELVRFCQRVGQAIAEDTLETGQGSGQQTPADDGLDRGIYA